MITCEEYQLLDELLQAQLLSRDGIYMMGRKTSKLNAELFALYNFYVEIFYDQKDDEPLYFKSFEFSRNLDSYLEIITIDAVFEKIK